MKPTFLMKESRPFWRRRPQNLSQERLHWGLWLKAQPAKGGYHHHEKHRLPRPAGTCWVQMHTWPEPPSHPSAHCGGQTQPWGPFPSVSKSAFFTICYALYETYCEEIRILHFALAFPSSGSGKQILITLWGNNWLFARSMVVMLQKSYKNDYMDYVIKYLKGLLYAHA